MDHETEAVHGKSKALVIGLVVTGTIVLSVGAGVALMKRRGADSESPAALAGDADVARWCELRKAWATEADSMAADVALKSVRAADREAKEKLEEKRDALCRDYGKQVIELKVADPRVIKVEEALIKEGKMRANIAVEIANALTVVPDDGEESAELDVGQRLDQLREGYEALQEQMGRRLEAKKAAANQEVGAALAQIPGCSGIYRGPMTDMGTSGSPYTSWRELEMRRKQAVERFREKIRLLEPREQYANHVYHEVVRKYAATLRKCYRKAKRSNPSVSSSMRLQIRLKRSGKVQSMAIREMEVPDDRILDCLLETAVRWRLPAPVSSGEIVVLPIDFAGL